MSLPEAKRSYPNILHSWRESLKFCAVRADNLARADKGEGVKDREPFERWLVRQLLAGLLMLVLILALVSVLPEVIGAIFENRQQNLVSVKS